MSSQELMEYICEQATQTPVIDIDAISFSEFQDKIDWLRSCERHECASVMTDSKGDVTEAFKTKSETVLHCMELLRGFSPPSV